MPKFNPDKYAQDYRRRNYDTITLLFPKGYRAKLKKAAQKAGFQSVNAMFNLLAAEMIRDYLDPSEPSAQIPKDAEQEPQEPPED